MRNLLTRSCVTLCSLIALGVCNTAQVAQADATGVTLKFGGGCLKSNASGLCVLKPRFSGFDLDLETALLYTCKSATGRCSRYSPRLHSVSEAGEVYMRIKNIPGACFQVRSGPNGNDKPDVSSKTVCEK